MANFIHFQLKVDASVLFAVIVYRSKSIPLGFYLRCTVLRAKTYSSTYRVNKCIC
jgi:hypothetical protein